jgi:hypothetical protein
MKARTLAPGELITAPGVYDLDMATYHGQPTDGASISSSGLRTIWSASPAHFWAESRLNPANWQEVEGVLTFIHDDDRPHFSLGRAAHHLLFLGRKGFDAEYVTRPSKWKDWRTNEAKEWRDDQIKAGLTILTDGELEAIAGMARSLAAHPMVKAGILDGAVERSLIWKDEQTGVWLKSRPDCIPNDCLDVSDLKTTTSVATDDLRRTLSTFGYHAQGAMVGMAMRGVLQREMQTFSLVFVETKSPHCVRVITVKPDDLARGEKQIKAAAAIFAECVETGQWPGPGGIQQDAEYLDMGEWARRQIDERLELLGVAA